MPHLQEFSGKMAHSSGKERAAGAALGEGLDDVQPDKTGGNCSPKRVA